MRFGGFGRQGWGLGLLALAAAGCSSSLLSSSSARDAEIEELKRQVVEQQKRATVSEVEAGRLKREISRLRAELEDARLAARTPPPPLTPVVETAEGEREIEVSDLEDVPIIEVTPASEARPEPPVPQTGAPQPVGPLPAAPQEEPSPEAQALYDEGYTFFHQGRYAEAEARFRHYVEQYPRSTLADNALFWIGECHFARGDFSAALAAFSDTVERFPEANKVGDALLKAGKCLEALGELAQARSTYGEVVRRFPGSAAAAQAQEKLDDR